MKPHRCLLPLAVAVMMVSAPHARAGNPDHESIISRQIEAFRAGDEEAAFSFASPSLQQLFRTPDNFIGMVRRGYAAVYAPRRFSFASTINGPALLITWLNVNAVLPEGSVR